MAFIARTIEILSGEFMLEGGRPNGGEVVVGRTIWIGLILIVATALIRGLFGDTSSCAAYFDCVLVAVKGLFTSAEALTIFGVTYAALYARFASQWGYIANLYNQIKQAEVEAAVSAPQGALATTGAAAASPTPTSAVLAQWKAGFIEDASSAHGGKAIDRRGNRRMVQGPAGQRCVHGLHTKGYRTGREAPEVQGAPVRLGLPGEMRARALIAGSSANSLELRTAKSPRRSDHRRLTRNRRR